MPSEAGPRPKRHKISIACDMCRARKVRCDGARPVCSNCLRRLALGDRCSYSGSTPAAAGPAATPTPPSHASVAAFAEPTSSPDMAVALGSREQAFPTPTPTQPPFYGPHVVFRSDTGSPSSRPGPANVAAEPAAASSMDSMTVVVEEGTHTLQYFGSSSAGSFTRQIKEAIDARMGASPGLAGMNSMAGTAASPAQMYVPQRRSQRHDAFGAEDEASLVLPRRREADRLVDLYWRYVDPLYPFLDRQTWTPAYEALFHVDGSSGGDADGADDRVFVSTLNVIFALSTQLSEGWPQPQLEPTQQQQLARQRERQCQVYFSRAQGMLQSSLWEAGSLETVQFLLLASQYLQSTNSPHQTWMVVGSTIRTAQSLGLHLPDSGTGLQPHDRELRRRLWHGCVLMDRMVSVTHGRPVMISSELCTMVPLPQCNGSASLAPGQHSGPSLAFFIKSVRLYEIINQVISAFYSTGPSHSPNESIGASEKDDLAKLLKLDEDLLEWERGLPVYVRFDLLEEEEARQRSRVDCRPRQAVILHIRYLQARILLLRPVTSRFCLDPAMSENSVGKSLRTRIKGDVANICVETAKTMIDVLERYQARTTEINDTISMDGSTNSSAQSHRVHAAAKKDDIGLLPAWWYRVYYLYSAASILVVAKLRPDVFSTADIQQAWDKAMVLLERHKQFGLAAHRCMAALDILGGHKAQAPGSHGGDGMFMNMRTDLPHHPHRSQSTFSDIDLAGLFFDAQDLSDLNMHAWEVLNQS